MTCCGRRAMSADAPTIPSTTESATQTRWSCFHHPGKRDDSLDAHQSLLKWCKLLSNAPRTLSSSASQTTIPSLTWESCRRNARVQEGARLISSMAAAGTPAFIENLGFPVFCKYFTPVDVVAKWAATAFGEPVQIGEVTIHTGDYVLGDRDGIVIIPGAITRSCAADGRVLRTENLVRKAILQGVDPVAAYLQYGKF